MGPYDRDYSPSCGSRQFISNNSAVWCVQSIVEDLEVCTAALHNVKGAVVETLRRQSETSDEPSQSAFLAFLITVCHFS